MSGFEYHTAFSRNIGWLTPEEQGTLRDKRVAIAGLGGVGGSHLLTLTRLGIGGFNIADLDTFEMANLNRQAGACLSNIGHEKVAVLSAMARDINPELDIRTFNRGVDERNIDRFLEDIDIYVDGLDYFAVSARRSVFSACAKKGIPAVTAAPLGMGAAVLNFLPGGMTFEQYFQLEGYSEQEQLIRFLLGLSPRMLQRGYLVHPEAVDFANHKGPSTPIACDICAGMAATQALKILLNRGKVLGAPWGQQFDTYADSFVKTWRPGGNRNPLQQIGLAVARRQLENFAEKNETRMDDSEVKTPLENILNLARWAPSGDNSQPWRFEIMDDTHIVIHGHDTRDHCVYDLRGHASQLAIGTLLQTLAIAATSCKLRAEFSRRTEAPDTHPTIDVSLSGDPGIRPDPLLPCIKTRMVNRRRLSSRPLIESERARLDAAVGAGYRLIWFSDLKERLKMARLLFRNGGLRLHLPEAFETHKSIIEWNTRTSEDKIPDRAVGLDPLTLKLMKWAMTSWQRVSFLNKYLAGSLIPRMELDFIPAIGCAAHFIMLADSQPDSIDDYIEAGKAVQRFWLTVSSLGLYLQPEMTPLIFDSYIREDITFTQNASCQRLARSLSEQLNGIISPESSSYAVFMGRVGAGKEPSARSIRRPLRDLLIQAE